MAEGPSCRIGTLLGCDRIPEPADRPAVEGRSRKTDLRCRRNARSVRRIVLLIIAFCELQPVILDGIFKSASSSHDDFGTRLVAWLKGLAAVLAPFSAAIAFLSRPIGRLLKEGAEKPTYGAAAMRDRSGGSCC